LGLPLLLIRNRNDIAGVGCVRDIQAPQENRDRSRLLSFIFNFTLLALAINLAASAIGNLAG
jgi:hypothetical protein